MSLLPQEFCSTQEEAGTHFPTHHVRPLITQNRQIAIRINPVLISIPDDGFRSRANNQFFFQFSFRVYDYPTTVRSIFQTMVCYYCTLLCKTFHMFRFTAEERLRNQQRKIGIHVSRFLKHIVQLTLHFLPDSVSVRFDHHTATHSRLFCQIGLHHQLIIPLRIILAAFGQIF